MSATAYTDRRRHLPYYRGYGRWHELALLDRLFREFNAGRVPPATKLILGLLFGIFVAQPLLNNAGYSLHTVSLRPQRVWEYGEVYRMWTAAWFHVDFEHVLCNALAVLSFERQLERQMGTLRHLECVVWAVVLSKVLYVGIAVLLHTWNPSHSSSGGHCYYDSAVGYSGVCFFMAVTECKLFPHTVREVYVPLFGDYKVSAAWYPWVLLLLGELFRPGSSWLGHLAGILAGLLHMMGMVDRFLLSPATLQQWETSPALKFLVHDSNYVEPKGSFVGPRDTRLRRSTMQTLREWHDVVNVRVALVAAVAAHGRDQPPSHVLRTVVFVDGFVFVAGRLTGLLDAQALPVTLEILLYLTGRRGRPSPTSTTTTSTPLYNEEQRSHQPSAPYRVVDDDDDDDLYDNPPPHRTTTGTVHRTEQNCSDEPDDQSPPEEEQGTSSAAQAAAGAAALERFRGANKPSVGLRRRKAGGSTSGNGRQDHSLSTNRNRTTKTTTKAVKRSIPKKEKFQPVQQEQKGGVVVETVSDEEEEHQRRGPRTLPEATWLFRDTTASVPSPIPVEFQTALNVLLTSSSSHHDNAADHVQLENLPELCDTLALLHKILKNAATRGQLPGNDKFRTLKMANPRIQASLVREGALELLLVAGFSIQDDDVGYSGDSGETALVFPLASPTLPWLVGGGGLTLMWTELVQLQRQIKGVQSPGDAAAKEHPQHDNDDKGGSNDDDQPSLSIRCGAAAGTLECDDEDTGKLASVVAPTRRRRQLDGASSSSDLSSSPTDPTCASERSLTKKEESAVKQGVDAETPSDDNDEEQRPTPLPEKPLLFDATASAASSSSNKYTIPSEFQTALNVLLASTSLSSHHGDGESSSSTDNMPDLCDILATLHKILKNAAIQGQLPGNEKFRTLKMSNPRIQACLAREGALELLLVAGFSIEDEDCIYGGDENGGGETVLVFPLAPSSLSWLLKGGGLKLLWSEWTQLQHQTARGQAGAAALQRFARHKKKAEAHSKVERARLSTGLSAGDRNAVFYRGGT